MCRNSYSSVECPLLCDNGCTIWWIYERRIEWTQLWTAFVYMSSLFQHHCYVNVKVVKWAIFYEKEIYLELDRALIIIFSRKPIIKNWNIHFKSKWEWLKRGRAVKIAEVQTQKKQVEAGKSRCHYLLAQNRINLSWKTDIFSSSLSESDWKAAG